jgi:hypothetical protein
VSIAASFVTPRTSGQAKNIVAVRISAARVRVANLRGEEFEEVMGSGLAAGGD